MCTIMDVLVSVTNQPSNKLYPSNLAVASSDRRRKFPFIFLWDVNENYEILLINGMEAFQTSWLQAYAS
jgi:hypothetical protein